VVPVDYRLSQSSLTTLLKQLDGIYIPGDASAVLSSTTFLNTVYNIIVYAQSANKGGHFPVVAVSYGLAAAIKCQTSSSTTVSTLPPTLQSAELQMHLLVAPSSTYIYDSMTTTETTDLFLNITVYNKMN
jgi:pterin-4a-carbinolamine dehydratase